MVDPSADALHGLCRLLGRLRLRHRRAAGRPPRRDLGALVAALDHGWPGCFLTLGIALGSWWAYYELGWGGWWFWDPVENASFMPWLVGTALIHSLAVTEKRGSFKSWTVLLAICAFSLSLLGTFLVRSGVLTSVHAFATDPRRGVFILAFLALVIGGSLALFAWRAPQGRPGRHASTWSRANRCCSPTTCCWSSAAGSVLLGTLYPLFLDALGLGKISVGPPYFDAVFVPLMAPARVPDGRRAAGALEAGAACRSSRGALRWALGVSVVTALLLPFAAGRLDAAGRASGLLLALWIVAATVAGVASGCAQRRRRPAAQLRRQPRSYWGMLLAHLGVAVFIVGVTMVKGYEIERDVRMDVGDTRHGRRLRTSASTASRRCTGPNYRGVARHDRRQPQRQAWSTTLIPEKRIYNASAMPMTEAAIDPGLIRRPLCLAGRAGRRAAPGACASTTSPSSTGSGAAAC